MKKKDLVSVIITTKNEDDVIKKLLQSINNQTYKKVEVILVDNNSEDNTIKIASKFKGVKIYNWGPERSAQRNYGVRKSFGEFLLFLDADMRLSPKVVESCVKATKSKKNIGSVVIPEQSEAYIFWEKVKAF